MKLTYLSFVGTYTSKRPKSKRSRVGQNILISSPQLITGKFGRHLVIFVKICVANAFRGGSVNASTFQRLMNR